MPELPEVETIRQDLKRKVINKKIVDVLLTAKARVQGVSKKKCQQILQANKFINIDRVGKLLIFVLLRSKSIGLPNDEELSKIQSNSQIKYRKLRRMSLGDSILRDKKYYLLIHLKMTGQLIYQQGKKIIAGGHPVPEVEGGLPNKFTRVIFTFSDRSKLYFNDMRRFGYMKIVNKKGWQKVRLEFGIEPLTKKFTFENFKKAVENRRTNIKAVLLNQKLFAGLGNIYADEACFEAKIRPSRRVDSLSKQELNHLWRAGEKVIKKAIEKRGTTFNNYVDSDGNSGNFIEYLKVYGRDGLKCRRCKKGIIKKIKFAGRGTHYCPKCQK